MDVAHGLVSQTGIEKVAAKPLLLPTACRSSSPHQNRARRRGRSAERAQGRKAALIRTGRCSVTD
jgi:hypothetical protein